MTHGIAALGVRFEEAELHTNAITPKKIGNHDCGEAANWNYAEQTVQAS